MSADAVQMPTTETPSPPICSCGTTERHPAAADRCSRGHVLVGNSVGKQFEDGNQAARTHGQYAYEARGAAALPDVLRQSVEQFREAVITDRGGASELSTLESAYIRRLSEVEAVARLLAADLASRGLTTAKGRVRSTFSRWLEALDRWDRLAQRVGTDRKARPMSLAARLAAAPVTKETEGRDAGE